MKYFAFVFALGCSGSALAVGLDFSMSATLFYESHFRSYEFGDSDNYYYHFAEWQSEAKRESLQQDFLETTFGENKFSYHLYSFGQVWVDRYSGTSGNSHGYGSFNGTFTIHAAGDYYIDAMINRGGGNADGPLLNRVSREDGSTILDLTDSGIHHSRQFLAAGTYTFNGRYHSQTTSIIYDGYAWQHIRLSVQAVPEPGTMLALSAGLAWMIRGRRKS